MFALFGLLVFFIVKNKMTLDDVVNGLNKIGAQPTALLVMIIGCAAFKISHDLHADTNVAAGIIACAIGLLNKQFASSEKGPKD